MDRFIVPDIKPPEWLPLELRQVVARLQEVGSANNAETQVRVYSEAIKKKQGLPNGLSISQPISNAYIYPGLIRDPGCGFLTFTIKGIPATAQNQKKLGELINQWVLAADAGKIPSPISWEQLLHMGYGFYHPYEAEAGKMPSLEEVPYLIYEPSEQEKEKLLYDINIITNTIEFHTVYETFHDYPLSPESLVGFIHSGSDAIPGMLTARFMKEFFSLALQQSSCTKEDFDNILFGIGLDTPEGQDYLHWLRFANNYCSVKQYFLYQQVKRLIEEAWPQSEVALIENRIHAGLLWDIERRRMHLTRGIQQLSSQFPTLIAGQRETLSAWVMPGAQAASYDYLVSHGIGYQQDQATVLERYINKALGEKLSVLASQGYYNTIPELSHALFYNYNLLANLDYYTRMGLCYAVAWLAPWVNIQTPSLLKKV